MVYWRYALLALVLLAGCSESLAQFAPKLEPGDRDYGPGKISARQARPHIGKHATVCGKVSKIKEAVTNRDRASGRPNYINLGDPGVNGFFRADFVIYISQADTPQFHSLSNYFGKTACVTGQIQSEAVDAGNWILPSIVAHSPSDITILNDKAQ